MTAAQHDGPYRIEYGDAWYVSDADRRHVCDGSQFLAVAFDAEDMVLHKHGRAERVEAWADKTRKMFTEAGHGELAEMIVVLAFPVTPETISELNACIATTGRIAGLQKRLEEIGRVHGPATRYPS